MGQDLQRGWVRTCKCTLPMLGKLAVRRIRKKMLLYFCLLARSKGKFVFLEFMLFAT